MTASSHRPELVIRPEEFADRATIRDINTQAFGQPGEADLVDALRAGGHLDLSLVAVVDGRIVGHIAYSPLAIVDGPDSVRATALAPVAILPEFQKQGIGSALIRDSLARLTAAGHKIVIVLGHKDYYPRFGFRPELTRALDSPYAGESFMALELVDGALLGVRGEVRYAPPFEQL